MLDEMNEKIKINRNWHKSHRGDFMFPSRQKLKNVFFFSLQNVFVHLSAAGRPGDPVLSGYRSRPDFPEIGRRQRRTGSERRPRLQLHGRVRLLDAQLQVLTVHRQRHHSPGKLNVHLFRQTRAFYGNDLPSIGGFIKHPPKGFD